MSQQIDTPLALAALEAAYVARQPAAGEEAKDRHLTRQLSQDRSDPTKDIVVPRAFDCHPDVRAAVEDYFATCGIAPGPIDEMAQRHSTLYLAWRRSENFQQLPSVGYAGTVDIQKDRNDSVMGEDIFRKQLADVKSKLESFRETWTEEKFAGIGYHSKAGKIYKQIEKMNAPSGVRTFFDAYVHDSYASFIGFFYEVTDGGVKHGLGEVEHIVAESKRYLTYRLVYQGDDQPYDT